MHSDTHTLVVFYYHPNNTVKENREMDYLLQSDHLKESSCLFAMIDVTDCQLIGKVDTAPCIHVINERQLVLRLTGSDLVR